MDINKLRSLLANDDKLVAQFLDIFKTETPKQLSDLYDVMEKKDWKSVSNIAHGIKSQVKYLDLGKIADMASNMELCAENEEDLESMPMYYFQLEQALENVIKSL